MAQHRDFLLPDLGEGLTEGEVVGWLVAVGDTVEEDQPVAEIETAKAVVQIPTPFAGTVLRLHAGVGDVVEVGRPLITIDLEGGPPSEPGAAPAEAGAAAMVPDTTEAVDEDAASGSVLVGYGTGGDRRTRRRRGAAPGPHQPPPQARPRAKPPVRKLAKDLGVDLERVEGTGPGGTITREDVHAFAGDGEAAPAQPVTGPAPAQVVAPAAAPEEGLVERVPVRGVRKLVAEKMAASRREIPEATTWVDCDATALWELRGQLNAAQDAVRVSALAIVLRACVAALREFPQLNARLDTDSNEIVVQRFVNLGFAAATDRGLLVPVIKRADRLSTLGIAAELERLAAAARDHTATPEELTGGTFTVSNYGSFGVDGGSAVINHPEAAILGVGQIADRPWVHDGQLAVRKVVQLSLAFDHRVCDGAEAGGFLRLLADCVQSPARLLGAL